MAGKLGRASIVHVATLPSGYWWLLLGWVTISVFAMAWFLLWPLCSVLRRRCVAGNLEDACSCKRPRNVLARWCRVIVAIPD